MSQIHNTFTRKNDVWNSLQEIMLKFDLDLDGSLNYKEFRALCNELFGVDEAKDKEWIIRQIFQFFDVDTKGILQKHDLHRLHNWIQETVNPTNILLIVDVQNDFIDGSLALRKYGGENGVEVVKPINRLLRDGRWNKVIYTQDWHPEDHISFFDNLGMRELHSLSEITQEKAKLFDTVTFACPQVTQKLWPSHCVMGTWGSELHKDLLCLSSSERVYKGKNSNKEEYSAFNSNYMDEISELTTILKNIKATHLYVCGLAYDICVKATCLDGLLLGYRLAVIDDCCRGINTDDIASAKALISENGGLIAHSDDVLLLVNEDKRSLVMAYQAIKNTNRK